MTLISNQAFKDVVELNGEYYLVRSDIEGFFERGYTTRIYKCDCNGHRLHECPCICRVEYECSLDAVDKGHRDIVSNLTQYISNYEEEQKRKKQMLDNAFKLFDELTSSFNADDIFDFEID